MTALSLVSSSASLSPQGRPAALVGRAGLEVAADLLAGVLQPTPQIAWPLLAEACDCEVWVKHENHNPTGAFKLRGGLVYMHHLKAERPGLQGVVTATRGNHGQSVALAARQVGLTATIVVPHGNNPEKNAATRAYGARLVEHGDDLVAAAEHAKALAEAEGLHMVPGFHPWLVAGVGTYGRELFSALPDLDAVFVSVGLGSGICGLLSARAALGHKARIYGVVSETVDAYRRSFLAGRPVSCDSSDTLADGIAVRVPQAESVELICREADDVLVVSDDDILQAMGLMFTATHNVAEGAGAAPLAALRRYGKTMGLAGKKVAVILSGGNPDRALFTQALAAAPTV